MVHQNTSFLTVCMIQPVHKRTTVLLVSISLGYHSQQQNPFITCIHWYRKNKLSCDYSTSHGLSQHIAGNSVKSKTYIFCKQLTKTSGSKCPALTSPVCKATVLLVKSRVDSSNAAMSLYQITTYIIINSTLAQSTDHNWCTCSTVRILWTHQGFCLALLCKGVSKASSLTDHIACHGLHHRSCTAS